MMAKRRKAFRRTALRREQNSNAVLPCIHCNEHRANDFSNHSLPNVSFGSENNRSNDCFRHPIIIMGEYLLYVRGRLVGGVYDDRLLVKPTPAAEALLPAAARERPYPGAKEMLLVEDVDDAEALTRLLTTLAEALPAPPP